MSVTAPGGPPRPDGPRAVVEIAYEKGAPNQFGGDGDRIKALFNPAQLRYSREIAWSFSSLVGSATPSGGHRAQFGEDKPKTLAIDLLFDTYEGPPDDTGEPWASLVVAPTARGVDVSQFTNRVAALAKLDPELHRPPRCKLSWGQFLLIQGVLTRFEETFSFFLPNGTPVRAVLSCTFTEALDAGTGEELHSADVAKRWTVRQGETLAGIAAAVYGDPRRWREIAAANGIDDPRRPPAGGLLVIPRLR